MNIDLKTTTYAGKVSFLDSDQVRYVRGGVTLEAAAVAADGGTGIKKLKGGTFLGKSGSKYRKYVAGTKAAVTLEPAGDNNNITITAKTAGVNTTKIELRDPAGNDKALIVTMENDTIVVSLATSGAGAITSTAAQVIAAINAALYVKDLVTAANAADNDGTGVVTAIAATPLAGGTADNVVPTLILEDDVVFTSYSESAGVTHRDQVATAIDQARVIVARLPEAPDATVKANMPGVSWKE